MSTYPEHEKLHAIADQSQAIGEFLDWCSGRGWFICRPTDDPFEGCYWPVPGSITDRLADYFGIDQKKLEQEKRQMLDEFRSSTREKADVD